MTRPQSRHMNSSVLTISDHSPEKRMFQSVLLVFLIDVQRDYDEFRNSTNGVCSKFRSKLRGHRHTAESEHMEMICDCAGMNYESFKERVLEMTEGLFKVQIKSVHY